MGRWDDGMNYRGREGFQKQPRTRMGLNYMKRVFFGFFFLRILLQEAYYIL